MRCVALTPIFIALLSSVGRAYINSADSVEWMAASAPAIIRAKVSDIHDTRADKENIHRECRLKQIEVLKGNFKPEDTSFVMLLPKDSSWGSEWKKTGDTYIFFLMPGDGKDATIAVSWTTCPGDQCAIDLDHPKEVYSSAMKVIDSPEEILVAIKKWSIWKLPPAPKQKAPDGLDALSFSFALVAPPGCLNLEIGEKNELLQYLYAGSSCYIRVPAEEKYREMAMKMTKSEFDSERVDAAAILLNYPGPETTKVLTTMLSDSYESTVESPVGARPNGEWRLSRIEYPVRAVAYRTLVMLGEKPERPIITRIPTDADIDAYNKRRVKP